MPTWTNIQTDDFENFQIEFNRIMQWWGANLNSRNVKRLDTNETVIKSQNGETIINGPLLQQYDSTPTLRAQLGLDTGAGDFNFKMWNAAGDLTVDLDASGNLTVERGTFKGDISTSANIYVGDNIYIGDLAVASAKTIQFYNAGGNQCYVGMDASGNLELSSYQGVEISSSLGNMDISSLSVLNLSGYDTFNLQTTDTTSTTDANITHDGSGNLYITHSGSGDINIDSNDVVNIEGTNGVVINSNAGINFNLTVTGSAKFSGNVAFFGGTPAAKFVVSDPVSIVTTETAGAAYTANEQSMLDHLKTDVSNLRTRLKGLCDALQSYNLV